MATAGHSLSMPAPPPSSLPPSQLSDDVDYISFSPTLSFTESFSTAYTSHTQFDSNSPALAPHVHLQNLRKSLSVDSFAQYNRDKHPTLVPRPSRGSSTSGSSRAFQAATPTDLKREREFRRPVDEESSVDSDVERSDPLNRPIDRYRLSSLKDQPRPLIRGGELPLPSRTPAHTSMPSVSSIASSFTNSSTPEDCPRQQSQSLQFFPGRGETSLPPLSGRIRSGSLGMYPSAGKRMLINTQVSAFDSTVDDTNLAVTLVVIGTVGCDKPAVIRKGLKGYKLSDPTSSLTPPTMQGHRLGCLQRHGRIAHHESLPDYFLTVIDVDVPTRAINPGDLTWPGQLSAVDGAIVCYDSSNEHSFKPVEGLLRGYQEMKVPFVVLACNSDLPRRVEPENALEVLQQYDVGLVEVAKVQEQGREKSRRAFEWLINAVFRDRRSSKSESDVNYRNPASPDILLSPPPWESSRTATPTASSAILPPDNFPQRQTETFSSPLPPIRNTILSNSPSRVRPTGDILYEHEESEIRAWRIDTTISNTLKDGTDSSRGSGIDTVNHEQEGVENQKEGKERESRPAQWATLEELLDKLLFLAVSGDDPAYITHFLLTYRRFATPRSVLLAMQKRMRQLDKQSGDPMFACFAQMRICHLLETWIRDYPHDFAVRGTAGALSALIQSIISKTYLLHYGSDFLPFLDMLPNLVDQDVAWALKVDDTVDGSDDSYSLFEEDDETQVSDLDPTVPGNDLPIDARQNAVPPLPSFSSRERKPSLPLPLVLASGSALGASQNEFTDTSEKQQIKDLVRLAQEVLALDPDDIAQEITKLEVKLFLDIQPRHWLYYTFVSGKKAESEPITAFNSVSNHLADWVVSLILCHERPKARVKQIEKFVEIAQKLRALNNYSALRAFVAGINNATFAGDETLEQFKTKAPEQAKNLQSWDVLLQQTRSHRAYRLALRNTKGACIPALEVHMSDLIGAHEGNQDFSPSDPTKIHWGKFNMIGRFVSSTVHCQMQCRTSTDYNFPDRNSVREVFVKRPIMNDELRRSRISFPDAENDNYDHIPRSTSVQTNPALLRKLFSW